MAITTVTPMIWLKRAPLLRHARQGLDGLVDREGGGGAVGGPVDASAARSPGASGSPRTTSAWMTPSPRGLARPVGGEHLAPGVERSPERALSGVLAVVEEPDHGDRRAGRVRGGRRCPRRSPSARSDVVGVHLAGGRRPRRGDPSGPARSRRAPRGRGRGGLDRRGGRRAARCRARRPARRRRTASTCRRAPPGSIRLRTRDVLGRRTSRRSRRPAGPGRHRCCWRSARRAGRPRNMSSTAMSVRMTVATAKRPGRRRSSRRASFIVPLPRWWPRSGRWRAPGGRPRSALSEPEHQQQDRPEDHRAGSKRSDRSTRGVTCDEGRVERDAEQQAAADHDRPPAPAASGPAPTSGRRSPAAG